MAGQQKFILITGISSGIGEALAIGLAKVGYSVIGTARNPPEVSDAIKNHANISIEQCDVTLTEDVERLQKRVRDICGESGLFGLINNAGLAIPGPMELVSEADFRHQMEVNVFAVRRMINTFLPLLRKSEVSPAVVNIGSISGLFTSPYLGPYCISKYALESMSDAYRRELHQFGIRVILLEPGPVKTRIWSKNKGVLHQYLDSVYGHHMRGADKMIEKNEAYALPVEKVVSTVLKAVRAEKPRPRYLIYPRPLWFKILVHFLPDRYVDKKVFEKLKSKDNFRPA